MTNNLKSKLDTVDSLDSFLIFVKALIADREYEIAKKKDRPDDPASVDTNAWENNTIERYLESAVAWAEDSKDRPPGLPEEPSWKAFATFLYCGKIYE